MHQFLLRDLAVIAVFYLVAVIGATIYNHVKDKKKDKNHD